MGAINEATETKFSGEHEVERSCCCDGSTIEPKRALSGGLLLLRAND
jgi:hypothetical protein